MIVCHCNVICSERIRAAVVQAFEETPGSEVTPAKVYARCRRAPSCGACQSAIRQIIDLVVAERAAAPVLPAATGTFAFIEGALPKPL